MINTGIRFPLDANAAAEYADGCLADGGVLAKLLAQRIDWAVGVFSALLDDPGVTNERAHDFKRGGIIVGTQARPLNRHARSHGDGAPRGRIELKQRIDPSSMVVDFLRERAGNLCLLEDVVARPDDPFLRRDERLAKYVVTLEDSVLYVLDHRVPAEHVSRAIRQATTAWHFVGALVRLAPSLAIPPGREIGRDMAENLLSDINCLLIGAYDGESVLVWNAAE